MPDAVHNGTLWIYTSFVITTWTSLYTFSKSIFVGVQSGEKQLRHFLVTLFDASKDDLGQVYMDL